VNRNVSLVQVSVVQRMGTDYDVVNIARLCFKHAITAGVEHIPWQRAHHDNAVAAGHLHPAGTRPWRDSEFCSSFRPD
jgi:hypothetical protein